ncbi:chloride channel protein [Desulfovibrio inopinatus]|uniref:chloride channel protein n=1 Tax=Desulfovibrio inopinatus TaxID=102109 RepID=UPI000418EB85|nr:chloride channel protein [Desulfovibrio inopinatus]
MSTPESSSHHNPIAAIFKQSCRYLGRPKDTRVYWRRVRRRDFLLHLGAIVIGALAAAGAILFRTLIDFFQTLFWPHGATFFDKVTVSPWWLLLLVPFFGGLVAGPVITFFVPEAKGPGVPEVILSVVKQQSYIRHRVTFLKAAVTSLLIGCGASVGREGPIVQIGASVGSSLARLWKLPLDLRRICLACGAAAGIAATFNAPLAGTLFAIEVILFDLEVAYITTIIIAAITASKLSRLFWGDFQTFHHGHFVVSHHAEIGMYLVLGLLSGLVAILFVRSIFALDRLFFCLRLPEWTKPALGGLLLGVLGLYSPYALGVGYESVNMALDGSMTLQIAFLVFFTKIVATSLCIGSGMSGGIFAPSLVLGAVTGTAFGFGLNALFPLLGLHWSVTPANYALAGMGAIVAGTTLAPITAILTIFELTMSYSIILPLMAACIVSAMIVRRFYGYSAYEKKLLDRGVNIVRGHDVGVLRNLIVRDFMTREFESLSLKDTFFDVLGRVCRSKEPQYVVLDDEERLVGVVTLRDISPYLGDFHENKDALTAKDIMSSEVVTLTENADLEDALNIFEQHRVSFVPVVSQHFTDHVIGTLKKDDVLSAYKTWVIKDGFLSCG